MGDFSEPDPRQAPAGTVSDPESSDTVELAPDLIDAARALRTDCET
jgi:hypothetical protein